MALRTMLRLVEMVVRTAMQILTPRKYELKLMDTIKNLIRKHLSLRMNLEIYTWWILESRHSS